jgi:hypothetical protein
LNTTIQFSAFVGVFEYTSAKVVTGRNGKIISSVLEISRFPHQIHLALRCPVKGDMVISRFNGRTVAGFSTGTMNTIVRNTSGLLNGVYLLSFVADGHLYSQRISIVK